MRHLFPLLVLMSSWLCLGSIARQSQPAAPLEPAVAAGHSCSQVSPARQQLWVYVWDSPVAQVHHRPYACRGLDQCPKQVVEVTTKQAKADYHRVPCPTCY